MRETIINDGLIEMSVSLKFLSERIILRVSVKYGDHRFACLRTKDSEKNLTSFNIETWVISRAENRSTSPVNPLTVGSGQ